MQLKSLFYLIILAEGYVVLATELLVIRLLTPFVGSGTETIAIIIAAVLMPLATGYYFGGKYKPKRTKKEIVTVREKLIRNLINSTFILTIGLSYAFLEIFFPLIEILGMKHRVIQTAIYCLLFVVYPVFLLGQTVPLISNYFSRQKLSEATGKMLFCSTFGSFFGSIISTLILMTIIGVHNTVIINILILVAIVVLLSKKTFGINNFMMLGFLSLAIFLNNNAMMEKLGIIENNNYSTIKIEDVPDEKDSRILNINRSRASKYSPDFEKRFGILKYVDKTFIHSMDKKKKMSILVVGAGGFTLGLEDDFNDYTFIDIDPSLKDVAEKHLLKKKLGANKHFIAEPARAFLNRSTQKYDFIFVDVYSNVMTIPPQLITKEFFSSIRAILKDKGIFAFNAIVSPNFGDRFSIKLDNTLRAVFPNVNRQVIQEYKAWDKVDTLNIAYSYFNNKTSSDIYTDDKNTYFLDR